MRITSTDIVNKRFFSSLSYSMSRNNKLTRTLVLSACISTTLLMSGCTTSEHSDLIDYVTSVKARKPGRIDPLPEFKTYESYHYGVQDMRSPFEPDSGMTINTGIPDSGIRPDEDRHKEALEAYPLDTLKFSGQLENAGQSWAIVTAPDNLVYRVQTGNYMGQNYGRIHTITESKISLTELIQDALGKWIERESSLALDE